MVHRDAPYLLSHVSGKALAAGEYCEETTLPRASAPSLTHFS